MLQGDQRPPVLLVDGYNLLGRVAGVSSDADSSDEETSAALASAFGDGPRLALQSRLCEYSHLRQVKVGADTAMHVTAGLLTARWWCAVHVQAWQSTHGCPGRLYGGC